MNYSRQRELILKALQDHRVHPTADDVYGYVKAELPNISIATVYRNLNLLAQNGKITRIPMPNGKDRFDSLTIPHYHMHCDQCDGVFDVSYDVTQNFDQLVSQKTGFQITSHNLIFYGTCKDCSAKNNNG